MCTMNEQWIKITSFTSNKLEWCYHIYLNLGCYYFWQPGITTDEIDQAVHQMIIDNGAYPSPLGYGGFPKSVCTSVNECICHGIPDSRPLEVCYNFKIFSSFKFQVTEANISPGNHWYLMFQDGDIINIDVTVYLNVSFYEGVCVLNIYF